MSQKKIAFQGRLGAYSHLSCQHMAPDMEAVPCHTFDDVFKKVETGETALGLIPVENSTAGRVADIHHLMPHSKLTIIGEHFQPVDHCLLGVKGATKEGLKTVSSHIQALSQCKGNTRALGLNVVEHADTAGAAEELAKTQDMTHSAIASELAAEIYDLEILQRHFQDEDHNTTRFLLLSPAADIAPRTDVDTPYITTFLFNVRNIPAALYKAMGGFATNGVNMLKLESYMVDGNFTATQFYADVAGHKDDENVVRALDELAFFTTELKILGSYPARRFRK